MMHWSGKIIGTVAGLLILGPLGAVIGFILGHCFDRGMFDDFLARRGFQRPGAHGGATQNAQSVFFDASFAVMGYVAKSDGRITEREIAVARQVMAQMGLSGKAKEAAIQQFYRGKRTDFNLSEVLNELKHSCWRHPSLLRTFIEVQLYMANAEGHMSPQKQAAIQNICAQLGLQGFNFHQYQEQARSHQQYSHQQQYTSRSQLHAAYQTLEVSETANASEVKKAYRRLMSKHHPDKLIAKGLPPEMIKVATQKTQQIKKAYEAIKQAKGW